MFWELLKSLLSCFRTRKSGYSIRGFWGELRHFNKDGKQIGYTVKGFWGERKRYDMNGNLISYSCRNFWGGYNTYDPQGNLIRRSYRTFWGGYRTYNKAGKLIVESYRNFWEGFNHFDVEQSDSEEVTVTVSRKEVRREYNSTARSSSTRSSNVPAKSNHINEPKQASKSESKQTTRQEHSTKQEQKLRPEHKQEQSVYDRKSCRDIKRDLRDKSLHMPQDSKSVPKRPPVVEQQINRSISYHETVAYALDGNVKTEKMVKLLAFSYKDLKEFPAVAYEEEDKVKVVPLIKNTPEFSFDKGEIKKAKKRVVTGLDMSAADNEFLSFGVFKLAKEFEGFFPEYQWDDGNVSRGQYEFACGLVITDGSMEALRRILG